MDISPSSIIRLTANSYTTTGFRIARCSNLEYFGLAIINLQREHIFCISSNIGGVKKQQSFSDCSLTKLTNSLGPHSLRICIIGLRSAASLISFKPCLNMFPNKRG